MKVKINVMWEKTCLVNISEHALSLFQFASWTWMGLWNSVMVRDMLHAPLPPIYCSTTKSSLTHMMWCSSFRTKEWCFLSQHQDSELWQILRESSFRWKTLTADKMTLCARWFGMEYRGIILHGSVSAKCVNLWVKTVIILSVSMF